MKAETEAQIAAGLSDGGAEAARQLVNDWVKAEEALLASATSGS